jgi:hypothetical protein
LSEVPQDPPLVRTVDTDGFPNPILYIEQLRRLPLARSRVPAPDTTLVFRSRSERLRAPAGGYTAGELFFLGPRTGYEIDMSPHAFHAVFEIGSTLLVGVEGSWRVTDPIEVVAHRVSDPEHACTTELREQINTALPYGMDSPEEVRTKLGAAWSGSVRVPAGIRLDDLRVDVTATSALTRDRVIRLLIADDEETDPADPSGADPGQLVQELRSLARDALAEHGADGVVGRALVCFQDLVTRMGDGLGTPDERAGDDRAR